MLQVETNRNIKEVKKMLVFQIRKVLAFLFGMNEKQNSCKNANLAPFKVHMQISEI